MYGLLLDSIQKFLREKYGERYWENIRRRAKLKNHWFVTHEVYSDSVMKDLVEAAAAELGEDQDTVMRMFGRYFAENIGRYGYARLLRVLGRDMRDFLNGLDDLHEYLRFSYPKMRPPSFICESETPAGMILHYTTQRRGYLNYVIGQLETIGTIYGKMIKVSILSEEVQNTGTHIVLDLQFDNREVLAQRHLSAQSINFTIAGNIFLGIFPFCLIFDQQLMVAQVGNRLDEVLPGIIGKHFNDLFTLRRPQFGGGSNLTWDAVSVYMSTFPPHTPKSYHSIMVLTCVMVSNVHIQHICLPLLPPPLLLLNLLSSSSSPFSSSSSSPFSSSSSSPLPSPPLLLSLSAVCIQTACSSLSL